MLGLQFWSQHNAVDSSRGEPLTVPAVASTTHTTAMNCSRNKRMMDEDDGDEKFLRFDDEGRRKSERQS